ncbi:MAG: hypothetical protein WDZ76_06210 [Pseudohongiellaceae bacterium]
MKKIIVTLGMLFSITTIPQIATAAVTADCLPGWFGSSTAWYSDCILWVQSEPQIVGALEVEVHNYTWGNIYQSGQQIASDSANAYGYADINLTEVSPGVYVMSAHAEARLYAYKYDSSSQGVTWDPLCARGKFSYYQAGTGWIYAPEFDVEECSYDLSTE